MAARVKAECDSLETIFQFKKRTMGKRAVEAPEKELTWAILWNGTEKLVMAAQSK